MAILPPPVTAKQRLVIIPDQPEEGIDSYGGKTLRKAVLRREWKAPRERSPSGPVAYQSMMMEKSWVMMTDRTDRNIKSRMKLVPRVSYSMLKRAVCDLQTGVN